MGRILSSLLLALLLASCSGATGQVTLPSPSPAASSTPAATPTPTLPPNLEIYLEGAIRLMEEKSIYHLSTDWGRIRSLARQAALGAQTTADLYPVLRIVLSLVGDRHGYVMPPVEVETYFEGTPGPPPSIHSELLEGRLAYLVVPTFVSGSLEAARQFAAQLQDAIREMDSARPCGWVLDVRYNEGGNGFAMLSGVSPLLGDGVYGYYAYVDGTRLEWRHEAGIMFLGEVPVMELGREPYQLAAPGAPVAVLANEVTTSAGELVAIAFHGWPHTRSFGQETLGRTTAPEGFFMSDGAVFAFSVAWFADHNGQVFEDGFIPEVRIIAHDDPTLRERTVPAQAIEWLLAQPACNGQ